MNTYVNKDGKNVPRVSTIIKLLNKEQLLYWANSLGYKHISYQHELDRTARIGTAVHEMIEKINSEKSLAMYKWNKWKIYNRYDRSAVIRAVHSYKKWYDKNYKKFKILFSEKTIVGDLFGGTIDTIIESTFNSSHIMVVDYKTSSDFHLTQILQLSAYVLLCEMEGFIVDGIIIIRTDKRFGECAKELIFLRKDLNIFIELFLTLYNAMILQDVANQIMKKNKFTMEGV